MSMKPKLTLEQALEIRRRYEEKGFGGAGLEVLARRYGVSTTTIHRILTGDHSLVRGVPNISGARSSIQVNDSGWSGRDSPTAPYSRDVQPTAALTRAQAIARPCPLCGARKNESCVNPRSTYPYPIKMIHQERRTPEGE